MVGAAADATLQRRQQYTSVQSGVLNFIGCIFVLRRGIC